LNIIISVWKLGFSITITIEYLKLTIPSLTWQLLKVNWKITWRLSYVCHWEVEARRNSYGYG